MLQKMKVFLLLLVGLCVLSFSCNLFADETSNTGFTSTGFMIDTGKFTIWNIEVSPDATAEQTLNQTLWTIIQKLMIGLWIVAFVVLVIGAGFMILAGWQDEYANRGKSIFTAGITALIVALSSYYLVALVRFLVFDR